MTDSETLVILLALCVVGLVIICRCEPWMETEVHERDFKED